MPKYRALVFPAGEINAVELHEALANCVNVEVFGASSIERHGSYVFANYLANLPLITEPSFMDAFRDLLARHMIDVVFPTHESVAEFLAENASSLPAIILGGDAFACAVCRDKKKTYELFQDEPFCPRFYQPGDPFPVFAKPRKGQGSVGATLVRNEQELALLDPAATVIAEYLPGEEYTVDCLTDNKGQLRVISPRSRLRVMAGISMAGRTEPLTPEIENIAVCINSHLNFLGLWWFQIKRDSTDRWKLLEISCRCAGSMILTRSLGINLPLLSVYTAMGREIEITANHYQAVMDSSLARRFRLPLTYSTVYIDFDDTIVINGKINLKAVWFIYQCRNQGKKLILLTRHENDIQTSLEKYALAERLFDEIIQLGWQEDKASRIAGEDSILIDNSWREREDVAKKLGIPVFDADGFDFLMEWVA